MQKSRNILACIIGNIMEWYEFSLFAYLSPIIATLFFPHKGHWLGLLSTFLVFALGFLVRPLGAILLGHLGDRLGRAKTLKFTILFISACSVLMGFLPTYAQVGVWAPILLVICRLLQGLCIGGEFAGAMIYLAESASPQHRALASSMTNNGCNIGVLLAVSSCAFLNTYLPAGGLASYGWRLLFMLGGIMGLAGLWLRRDITESQVFRQLQERIGGHYVPIKFILKRQRVPLMKILLLLFVSACGSYTLMNYLSTYLHVFLKLPLTQAYRLQTIFIFLSLCLVPLFAYLSDKYGRRSILLFSTVGYLIVALPVFGWMQASVSWWLLIPLALFYSAEQAVIPVTIVELFPGKGRYTGISLAYNIAMALVGGTSPALNTFLIGHFHNKYIIAYHVMFCAFVSLMMVLALPRRYGSQRNLTELYA